MLDILEGLRHLYMNGFIHCNVKPSNILICFDGAKLTDFGQTRKIG
jgi:serine/threonine protein kinase